MESERRAMQERGGPMGRMILGGKGGKALVLRSCSGRRSPLLGQGKGGKGEPVSLWQLRGLNEFICSVKSETSVGGVEALK